MSSNGWKEYKFSEILSTPLRNGVNKPTKVRGDGYKMVNMGELFANPIIRNMEMARVPMTDSELKNCLLQSGDLLFARQSLTIEGAGKCSLFIGDDEPYTFEGHLIRARVNREIASPQYVYYYFKSFVGKSKIETLVHVTAAAGIRSSDLSNLNIELPPLSTQLRIANILSALGEKIELNRQTNATLEAIAQSIFKEWFVDGEDIDDWEVGKLGDIAENIRRSVQPSEIEPDTPYIGLEHMPRGSIALSEWDTASDVVSNKYLFKQDEFLFGKLRPYFHKVGVAPLDGVSSTDILVVAPKGEDYYGVVLGHISSVELINHTSVASTGTKMPRTNWSDIARYEIALPPRERAKKFSVFMKSVVQLIQSNIMEARTLASIRDTLLPKLMSGEINVSQINSLEEII